MMTLRRSDGRISVLNLYLTPEGLALNGDESYRSIGQVKKVHWTEQNPRTGLPNKKEGWGWWYDERGYGGARGTEMIKDAAVAAVLRAGGYVEAPPNATNVGLFEL
jgi:hypothetical protein